MLGRRELPARRGNYLSSQQRPLQRTRPAVSPVPGTGGSGGFQNPATDPGRPGSDRRRREGGKALRAHAAAARTRPRCLGLGLESQLGSRSPDGPRAGKGGAARGREQRRRPPLAAGLFIPGKKFRNGRQGRRAGRGGGMRLGGGGRHRDSPPSPPLPPQPPPQRERSRCRDCPPPPGQSG